MTLTVHTWKGDAKGLGFATPIKSSLWGGNVGHAALELTWPANAAGDELAQRYQNESGIKISKRTETVSKMVNGIPTPEQHVVYAAYFSWWPGNQDGHSIHTPQKDRDSEWLNEPEGKMSAELERKIYGEQGMGKNNETEIEGLLVRTKTIKKIYAFESPALKKHLLQTDLHLLQLQKEKQSLMQKETNHKAIKTRYEFELAEALRENELVEEDDKQTEEEIISTVQSVLQYSEQAHQDKLAEIKEELKLNQREINACLQALEERYSTQGKDPDASIILPTSNDEHGLKATLDTEQMLKKMVEIAQSKVEYSFYKYNCSTTVTDIIVAGVNDDLKEQLQGQKFNLERNANAIISTPTAVNVLSMKLQSALLKIEGAEAREKAQHSSVSKFKSFKNYFREAKEKCAEPNDLQQEALKQMETALAALKNKIEINKHILPFELKDEMVRLCFEVSVAEVKRQTIENTQEYGPALTKALIQNINKTAVLIDNTCLALQLHITQPSTGLQQWIQQVQRFATNFSVMLNDDSRTLGDKLTSCFKSVVNCCVGLVTGVWNGIRKGYMENQGVVQTTLGMFSGAVNGAILGATEGFADTFLSNREKAVKQIRDLKVAHKTELLYLNEQLKHKDSPNYETSQERMVVIAAEQAQIASLEQQLQGTTDLKVVKSINHNLSNLKVVSAHSAMLQTSLETANPISNVGEKNQKRENVEEAVEHHMERSMRLG